MSNIPDALSQLLGESSGDPVSLAAALLEVLLAAAVTRSREAMLEAALLPPPQVMVRWRSHEIAFARAALQSTTLLGVYRAFTQAFELTEKTFQEEQEQWEPNMREHIRYVPMKLYATFLRSSGAEKKTDHELSGGEGSWQAGILQSIDEIHIFTMPEHRARREKEEKLFREASREQEGDNTSEGTTGAAVDSVTSVHQ